MAENQELKVFNNEWINIVFQDGKIIVTGDCCEGLVLEVNEEEGIIVKNITPMMPGHKAKMKIYSGLGEIMIRTEGVFEPVEINDNEATWATKPRERHR